MFLQLNNILETIWLCLLLHQGQDCSPHWW